MKLIKPLEIENRSAAWTAFVFVAFVFVFESIRFGVNYSEYFVYLYDSVEIFSAIISAACLLGSLTLFYFFVLSVINAAPRFKVFYFILFLSAIIVEYGYQKALGRYSLLTDIESVVGTTSDQKIASIFLYLNLNAIVPLGLFLLLLLIFKTKEPKGLKTFLRNFAAIAVCFVALSCIGSFFIEKNFPTVSFGAFYRTSTDFLLWGPLSNGKWAASVNGNEMKRRQVKKPALAENFRPANNIVLVLDESVRGDHFSLNGYERKTTPTLDNLRAQGVLSNWGIAVSASTGSRFSYNTIITGLTPDDFPDKTEIKINTFPTIFQYAKAMNYKTYYLDGQMKNYWAGIPDDVNFIDNWLGVNNFNDNGALPKYEIDNRIAAEVNKIISTSTGNFIFIFKHGSHIPYQESFPPNQQVYQPSYTTDNKFDIPSADQLEEVANSYDNAIKYNVNAFFDNLIKDYTKIPHNTVIIYTGDHGQTLFTNGKSSHGGKTKVEADVPLLMIGKLDKSPDTNYRASHYNIFPTLLDLMNYPEDLREKRNSISLLKATTKDSRQRFFNPDLGEKIPFD